MTRRNFRTHLLDAAAARRGKRLEAERKTLLEKVIRALRSEAAHLGVTEAYVVGSLAKEGEWTERSDVDVAISGGEPLEVDHALGGQVVESGGHVEAQR
jgi:predicted nucleotidyltransferase